MNTAFISIIIVVVLILIPSFIIWQASGNVLYFIVPFFFSLIIVLGYVVYYMKDSDSPIAKLFQHEASQGKLNFQPLEKALDYVAEAKYGNHRAFPIGTHGMMQVMKFKKQEAGETGLEHKIPLYDYFIPDIKAYIAQWNPGSEWEVMIIDPLMYVGKIPEAWTLRDAVKIAREIHGNPEKPSIRMSLMRDMSALAGGRPLDISTDNNGQNEGNKK